MAKLKFYTDEHIAKAVVKGLKVRGIDAVTCVEAGMRTASDKEHIVFAHDENRVIVTYDNDFLKLHYEGIEHSGIAFSQNPVSIGEMINFLLLMHEVLEEKDMKNAIEFI